MATETQAFLDEFKTPSIKTPGSANLAIKAFAPEIGLMAQQIAKFSGLILEAEITEADDPMSDLLGSLRARLHSLSDRIRLLTDYNATVRSLWRDSAALDAEIRQYSTDNGLGYTV